LRIADVDYQGPFTRAFIEDVSVGKYPVKEGVVAKGVHERVRRRGKTERSVWMAKVKTQGWLDELRRRSGDSDDLRQQLEENLREQVLGEEPAEVGPDEEESEGEA
jgi:hypothetical protein